MKIKGKIEKLSINIVWIYENDNYCELEKFTQIENYYELERVQTLLYSICACVTIIIPSILK